MARYEHPYRLDAAVVEALLAHLNRLINASNGEMRCDRDDMRVPLLTARHLSTLINVSFWASFKKEEARSVRWCPSIYVMNKVRVREQVLHVSEYI